MWLANPRWRLSCPTCVKYMVTPDGPELDPETREPLLRIGTETPCMSCPKVPPWAQASFATAAEMREVAAELDDRNRAAVEYYYRMKAVGWPEPVASDPVCQWYAGVMREVEDDRAADLARSGSEELTGLVTTLLLHAARTRR